jgi:hypothetical protein
MPDLNRPLVGSPILKQIITHIRTPFTSDFYTHTPITTHIHTTTVVIMVPTALITTLTAILITVVVLEAEGSKVVAGAEDVEDLDRIRDPLRGEFEPRVPTKKDSTAGSEVILPFIISDEFLKCDF